MNNGVHGDNAELRLALGMRGGVSLAVWIGGACAEINALRCAGPPSYAQGAEKADGSPFWTEVLKLSPYSSVVVDVLAGASAGGFNGVVFAASHAWGFSLDRLKDLWATSGDLNKLVRHGGSWPSLLDGDEKFLKVLEDNLGKFATASSDRPGLESHSPPLDLRLSATLLEPVVRPVPSPIDESLHESRFAGSFHFRHPAAAWLPSHLPPAKSPAAGAARYRLTAAARATSSYPVAFEAARIVSRRAPSFGSEAPEDGGSDVDMAGAFGDRTSAPDGAFLVGDGGVLDNIPLGRALDAVAATTADGPTRRVLLYLHPGVPEDRTPSDTRRKARPSDPRASRWVLQGMVKSLWSSESIDRDIRQLEDHNAAVARAAAARTATFASLEVPSGPLDKETLRRVAEHLTPVYARQRNDADAAMIGRLLEAPIAFLGDDPFPASVDGTTIDDALWRSPLGALSAKDRGAARQRLWELLTAREPDSIDTLVTGTRPLRRVTQLVLEWARWREATSNVPVQKVGVLKEQLYELLTVVDELLERPRRLGWVAGVCLAQAEGGSVDNAIGRYRAVDSLLHVPVEGVAQALADPSSPTSTQTLHQVRSAVYSQIDSAARQMVDPASAGTTAPAGTELRIVVREQLLATVRELRSDLGSSPARTLPDDVAKDPARHLDRVLGGPDEPDAATLGALEILCYREFAVGLPARSPIELFRLSAAARTPVARHLPKLDPQGEQIPHANKLAGNLVRNFSAFFVEKWRANDWFWGRMDAVPTLVDLLVDASSLRAWLRERAEEAGSSPLETLHDLVTTTDRKDKVLEDALDEEWKDRQRAVREELDDLAAGVPTDLRAVRDALIARRQWELLRRELAPGRRARHTLEKYDVGMQTLQTPGPELGRLKAKVKRAARRTVWHNLPWELRGVRGLAVRAAIRVAVWAGFKVVTAPPKESTASAGRQGAEESPPPD